MKQNCCSSKTETMLTACSHSKFEVKAFDNNYLPHVSKMNQSVSKQNPEKLFSVKFKR